MVVSGFEAGSGAVQGGIAIHEDMQSAADVLVSEGAWPTTSKPPFSKNVPMSVAWISIWRLAMNEES